MAKGTQQAKAIKGAVHDPAITEAAVRKQKQMNRCTLCNARTYQKDNRCVLCKTGITQKYHELSTLMEEHATRELLEQT